MYTNISLVTENGEKELPQLKSFEDFSPENIKA